MSLKNHNYSPNQLLRAASIEAKAENRVSVGQALDKIRSLGVMGKELKGDCDGIDALCYNLDKYTVQTAIEVLNDVLKRFETEYATGHTNEEL